MNTNILSLMQLLDLVLLEDYRGTIDIDKANFLQQALGSGVPKIIKDVRGDTRLAIDRVMDGFEVTQYQTKTSIELVGQIR